MRNPTDAVTAQLLRNRLIYGLPRIFTADGWHHVHGHLSVRADLYTGMLRTTEPVRYPLNGYWFTYVGPVLHEPAGTVERTSRGFRATYITTAKDDTITIHLDCAHGIT